MPRLISYTQPVVNVFSAVGILNLSQQYLYRRANTWPIAGLEPAGSSTTASGSSGTVYQPAGWDNVIVTLNGSNGGPHYAPYQGYNGSNYGGRIIATNVPVSGLKIYTDSGGGTNSNSGRGYNGGSGGFGYVQCYDGGQDSAGGGGPAAIAVNSANSVILVAGGGGGTGQNGIATSSGGSGSTNGQAGGDGTHYYGGGGGGGGVDGGLGNNYKGGGGRGTSTAANSSVNVVGYVNSGRAYGTISWGS